MSIVNGSFVTLRDPWKYCDKNIHIRDNLLLAAGGIKNLNQIGKELKKNEIKSGNYMGKLS